MKKRPLVSRRKMIAFLCAANFLLAAALLIIQSIWLPDLEGQSTRIHDAYTQVLKEPFPRLAPNLFRLPATSPSSNRFYELQRQTAIDLMNGDWNSPSQLLIELTNASRQRAQRATIFFYIAFGIVLFNAVASLFILVILPHPGQSLTHHT